MPSQFFSVRRPSISADWAARNSDGYDVVIIGSGYGGAVSAARIVSARYPGAKPSVCVLERGKEWFPGTFPDKTKEARKEFYNPKKNPLGLYRFKADLDVAVFQGSGLGGTSLVNANVAYEPEPEVFDDPRWPQAIRDARDSGELPDLYKKIRKVLSTAKHPRAAEITKVQALKAGKPATGATFFPNQLAVNFKPDGPNKWGVPQRKCLNCGDCITGCNPGAKNTLDTNYLAIAQQNGAHLFPQVTVHRIAPHPDGGYEIHYTRYTEVEGKKRPAAEDGTLRAKRAVIVSGGSLGSTEILLRSRDAGMPFSDQLGERFGGNGDFFGVAYNSNSRTNVLGWGAFPTSKKAKRMQPQPAPGPLDMLNPGPTIVSTLRYNRTKPFAQRVTVQDTSIPKMYVDLLRSALSTTVELTRIGSDTDPGEGDLKELRRRALDFAALGRIDKGALNHSLMYLVMGVDSASGRLEMSKHQKPEKRKLKIKWRGAGKEAVYDLQNELLEAHAVKLGARWIEHPIWSLSPWKTLITVHPLGGCPMGESSTEGVVDERGRVFDPGGGFHPGFYVTDGSILPAPVGSNPFMTISALSDRVAAQVVSDLGGTP